MNMKKIASVVLALALSVSVFAACGSNGNSSASSTASTESSTASTDSSTASTDSSAAATGDKIDVLNQSETMDVSVAVMTGFTAADSRVQKELEEKYNVKFNLVVLPGWADGQSQISLLMASNDMPNIMWWWTMDTEYNKWVKAGLLDDVSAYMDNHEQPPEAAEIRKKQKYPCNRRFRQRQDPVLCETVAHAMYVKGFSNVVYRH